LPELKLHLDFLNNSYF